MACFLCAGPLAAVGVECRLPDWAREGTSNHANDIPGQRAFLARCHKWLTPRWLADVERHQAAIRAMPPAAPTFACLECGRHAFPAPTLCFWCQAQKAAPSSLATAPAPFQAPAAPEPLPALSTRQKRRVVENPEPPAADLFG